MKNFITITTLLTIISFPSFSQIKNDFFGAILGISDINSTYYSMRNYFGKEPTNTLYFGEDIGALSISKETFAGYNWDAISTYFHNDKLCTIIFRYHDNFKYTEPNVINRYNSLQKELTAKYGRLLKVNESDKNGAKTIYYFDGKYAVCLGIRWKIQNNKKIYYETKLEYHDVLLKEQPIINNDL